MIRISTDPDVNWRNDAIQFPRLISELLATSALNATVIEELAVSMDVSVEQLNDIFDRADTAWNDIKERTPR